MRMLLCILFLVILGTAAQASDLRIATFNTESDDDTDPVKVAESIKAIGSFDILALQEVEGTQALKTYAEAAAEANGGTWRFVISESGFNSTRAPDFLGILYRTDLFRQLETSEIHLIRSRPGAGLYGEPDWSLRGALVLRLQQLSTGGEFQVATIHLKCCNEPGIRSHQAKLLAKALRDSALPTILLGDSNVPIEPGQDQPSGANADAFTSLTVGVNLKWIKPQNPVKTQCDPRFNSMLDQIYASPGFSVVNNAEIKFPEPSYCEKDAEGYSDHRPIVTTFGDLSPTATTTSMVTDGIAAGRSEEEAEAEEFRAQLQMRPDDFVAR